MTKDLDAAKYFANLAYPSGDVVSVDAGNLDYLDTVSRGLHNARQITEESHQFDK